jgi:pyruvate,water dikinase
LAKVKIKEKILMSVYTKNLSGPNDEQIVYQGKKAPFEMQIAMEYFPEPLFPLDFAYLKQRYAAFNALVKDIGMNPAREQVGLVERESGAVAVRIGKVGLSPAVLWKAPSVFLINFSKEARELWQPLEVELDAWLASMEAANRNTSNPVKLALLIERALDEFGELFHRRFFTFFIPALVTGFKFDYWVKKAVGKENAGPVKESLLRALPFRTALQNKALLRLAQTAASKGRDSQIFKEEIKRFLEEYGDRPSLSTAPTLGAPVWRERPEMIQELVDALLQNASLPDADADFKKQEADYAAAKKQVEQGLKPGAYHKFEKVLVRARSEVIVREESSFYMEKLTACMRRMILKLGELLAKKLLIRAKGDVFFLFLDELAPVAQGGLDLREKIEKRKQAFVKTNAAHQKGVHWLISSGSYPVFEAKKTKQTAEKADADTLKGLSASRGIYEGRVCIVRSPAEFNKLKKGDILVATYTAPVWTSLFRVASAVIAETGSPSSHAAIVAREYGIPCVVAIENVTNILKDGQRIRVDGNTGVVTRLG